MAKFRDVFIGAVILVFWFCVFAYYAKSVPGFDMQKACQPEGQVTCPGDPAA